MSQRISMASFRMGGVYTGRASLLPRPPSSALGTSSTTSTAVLSAELGMYPLKEPRRQYNTPIRFLRPFFILSFLPQAYCFQNNRAVGKTPYGKRHTSRTKPVKRLQSIVEEGLRSPPFFLTTSTSRSLKRTPCWVCTP